MPRPRPHTARTRSSRPMLLVAVSMVALAISACGGSDGDADEGAAGSTKVTVGWPGAYEVWGSAIVADGMGVFEDEGLDVEFTTIDSSNAVALMESGDIDVFVSSVTANIFNAISSGAELKWVAPAFLPNPDSEEGVWVRDEFLNPDGSVNADKLKGTALGLGSGGLGASNAVLVVPWLQELGLEPTDFEYPTYTGPDILVALENEAVSAGWLTDPYWASASESGIGSLQVGFAPDQSIAGYMLSGELLDERRETGEAFVRALARTNEEYLAGDYHSDDEVVKVLADAIGVKPDQIASGSGYTFPADLAFDHHVVETLQEVWLQVGGILEYDEPIPVDDVIDATLTGTS